MSELLALLSCCVDESLDQHVCLNVGLFGHLEVHLLEGKHQLSQLSLEFASECSFESVSLFETSCSCSVRAHCIFVQVLLPIDIALEK